MKEQEHWVTHYLRAARSLSPPVLGAAEKAARRARLVRLLRDRLMAERSRSGLRAGVA